MASPLITQEFAEGTHCWSAMADRFDTLPEYLEYVDQPLEGYVRSLKTNQTYAFRTVLIVPRLAWHWILIPMAGVRPSRSAYDEFQAVCDVAPQFWISIIEDGRLGHFACTGVCLAADSLEYFLTIKASVLR